MQLRIRHLEFLKTEDARGGRQCPIGKSFFSHHRQQVLVLFFNITFRPVWPSCHDFKSTV